MKNFVKVISLILVVFSISSLCSCSVFTYDKARFEGGETLDEELLSKIENDLHNGDHTSEETTIDPPHNSAEESGQETQEDSSIVYWTSSGTVWHTKRDCSHIRNSQNVISGTVEEAISSGKKQLCSSCQKKQGT